MCQKWQQSENLHNNHTSSEKKKNHLISNFLPTYQPFSLVWSGQSSLFKPWNSRLVDRKGFFLQNDQVTIGRTLYQKYKPFEICNWYVNMSSVVLIFKPVLNLLLDQSKIHKCIWRGVVFCFWFQLVFQKWRPDFFENFCDFAFFEDFSLDICSWSLKLTWQ